MVESVAPVGRGKRTKDGNGGGVVRTWKASPRSIFGNLKERGTTAIHPILSPENARARNAGSLHEYTGGLLIAHFRKGQLGPVPNSQPVPNLNVLISVTTETFCPTALEKVVDGIGPSEETASRFVDKVLSKSTERT